MEKSNRIKLEKTITLKISPEMLADIQQIMEGERVAQSVIVREALAKYIRGYNKRNSK